MTISQVVRFFDGFGIDFTKTMIQNYVRVGVIDPPVEKRYYVKKHLILLAMIYELKDIYSLDEIGLFFKLSIKNNDDEHLTSIYNEFRAIYEKIYSQAPNNPLLDLMVQTTVNKKIVKNMMDNELL